MQVDAKNSTMTRQLSTENEMASLNAFSKNPSKSILCLKSENGNNEITVMSKGIWTWIKIHIGSALGLFDKASIKMSNIAAYVFNPNESPDWFKPSFGPDVIVGVSKKMFMRAFIDKLGKWEANHFEVVKGPLSLKFNASEVAHIPLNLSDGKLSQKFIDALPENSRVSSVNSYNIGNSRVVTLHMSQFSELLQPKMQTKKAIDQEALLRALLNNKELTSNPLALVEQQGYKAVRLTLTNDPVPARNIFQRTFTKAPEPTVSAQIEILGHR